LSETLIHISILPDLFFLLVSYCHAICDINPYLANVENMVSS